MNLEEDKAREIESALHTHREQWREARDRCYGVCQYDKPRIMNEMVSKSLKVHQAASMQTQQLSQA